MTIAFLGKRNAAVLGLVLAGAAIALFLALRLGPSPRRREGVEPRRGTADRPGPARGQHRPVRVRQPRPARHDTIVANYIPLEAPASGPNFYSFDDSVLYEINIDNTGDGREDITYQFRFKTTTRNPNTFLYNVGPITSLGDPNWNRPQTYSVTLVRHGKGKPKTEVLGTNIPTPPDNIGPRSTPAMAPWPRRRSATFRGGIKVFAGQRDDPFFVDLGSVFDLAGLRPFNPFHLIPLGGRAGRGRARELQHAHDRASGAEHPVAAGAELDHRRVRAARFGRRYGCSARTARPVVTATSCRSRGSASR